MRTASVMKELNNDRVTSRSSHQWCPVKKSVLRIFTQFTGKHCARASFLIKKGLRPATLLKKRLWHRCFPVNFAKILRTPFLQNTSERLLLYLQFVYFELNSLLYISKNDSFLKKTYLNKSIFHQATEFDTSVLLQDNYDIANNSSANFLVIIFFSHARLYLFESLFAL